MSNPIKPSSYSGEDKGSLLEGVITSLSTFILLMIWFFSGNGDFDPLIQLLSGIVSVLAGLITRFGLQIHLRPWQTILLGTFIGILIAAAFFAAKSALEHYLHTADARRIEGMTSNWKIVMNDPFHSNTGMWSIHDEDNQYALVHREIRNGRYLIDIESRPTATVWGGFLASSVEDFYVEVDVHKLYGPIEANCGIMFRFQDGGNWHFFRIREDQQFSVSFFDQGKEHTRLIQPTYADVIQQEGVNHLAIFARGSRFEFLINGKTVDTLNYDPLGSGSVDIGIQIPERAGKASCEFDNFKLKIPPSS